MTQKGLKIERCEMKTHYQMAWIKCGNLVFILYLILYIYIYKSNSNHIVKCARE